MPDFYNAQHRFNRESDLLLHKISTIQQVSLYQSLFHQLSLLPVDYLQQVEQFVVKLNQQKKVKGKKSNREKILALAGSRADISDADFEEMYAAGKTASARLFARELEL